MSGSSGAIGAFNSHGLGAILKWQFEIVSFQVGFRLDYGSGLSGKPVHDFGPAMDFKLTGQKVSKVENLSKLKSFWILNRFLVDSFIDKV